MYFILILFSKPDSKVLSPTLYDTKKTYIQVDIVSKGFHFYHSLMMNEVVLLNK